MKTEQRHPGRAISETLVSTAVQLRIVALFALLWVFDATLIVRNLRRDSRKYHVTYLAILYNALIKYPMFGFRPSEFFMYHLTDDTYQAYLPFFPGVTKIIAKNKHTPYLLHDKVRFKTMIQGKIPAPELIATYDHKKKTITYYARPASDLFVIKPQRGMWGKEVRLTMPKDLAADLRHCKKNCIVETYVRQHQVLNTIYPGSVNTLRILTAKKSDEVCVIHAIQKFGRTRTRLADNIAQGGISTGIDMETGVLGTGSTSYEFGHEVFTKHPDTHIAFRGVTVPFFHEALDIAIRAHRLFPMFTFIGWDIALTEHGPLVLEGNRIPDLSLHQIHCPLKKQLSRYFA
jgi:hypothetical protein